MVLDFESAALLTVCPRPLCGWFHGLMMSEVIMPDLGVGNIWGSAINRVGSEKTLMLASGQMTPTRSVGMNTLQNVLSDKASSGIHFNIQIYVYGQEGY